MIKKYGKNEVGRDFVVGDIHGCFSRLAESLYSVGFDGEKDRLFSVGDLVDRGIESHLVCEWIAKQWFHAVRGNHDDFAIRHAKKGALDFENYTRNGGAWFIALPKDEQLTIAIAESGRLLKAMIGLILRLTKKAAQQRKAISLKNGMFTGKF